jgi:hypothetical protein
MEFKGRKETLYSGYIMMCKILKIKPIEFDSFNEIEFNNVRETYLTFK